MARGGAKRAEIVMPDLPLTLILSSWGAALSTALAILTFFDRTRARPIIRACATMRSQNASENSQFVTAPVKVGSYDDVHIYEFFVEFRVENHGTKPLALHHVYIEHENGNLIYITPDGLPLVLEGQSSAKFEIQKEYFDDRDITTQERRRPDLQDIGFVDALDRRYSVPKKQLEEVLNESLLLPTTRAVYAQKNNPERRVLAFKAIHPQTMMRRSRPMNDLKFFSFRRLRFWHAVRKR
jgi:hypothetical protein